MIEVAARVDASAGWNLAIGNGSLGFIRGLDESAATEILSTPRVLAAASLGPGIRLRQVEGGFIVSGRGAFASGCSQANWFGAGGLLLDAAGPVRDANGAPAIRMGIIPRDQVEIDDTWNVTGLRGTGSHDIVLKDIFVPAARVLDVSATGPRRFDPLGAIPVQLRLGSHITAVAIGATWHAVEELKTLANAKPNFGSATLIRDRPDVQIAVGRATGLVDAARVTVTSVIAKLAPRALLGEPIGPRDLARLRLSYVTAGSLCVEAVDLVHGAAGTTTLAEDSVIGRCWRDVHAVAQHVSQQTKHFETAGRVMLGLPPQGLV
jgi:alkylation response protein AidB-like acyl-CoA dehydrogenase